MRLSNQGQTLESQARVGGVKLYVKKKKNCLLILILRLLFSQWKIQRRGGTKNLKMQEPEMPDSVEAYLLCKVSCKCLLGICFRSTAIFFVPALLLIQSFPVNFF